MNQISSEMSNYSNFISSSHGNWEEGEKRVAIYIIIIIYCVKIIYRVQHGVQYGVQYGVQHSGATLHNK
jgi:hypothetical protein